MKPIPDNKKYWWIALALMGAVFAVALFCATNSQTLFPKGDLRFYGIKMCGYAMFISCTLLLPFSLVAFFKKRSLGIVSFAVWIVTLIIGFVPVIHRHVDGIDATDMLLQAVVVASRQFKAEFDHWPSSIDELTNNTKKIVFIEWDNEGPVDPWKNKIIYMPFNQETGYGLTISWGADGKPGGVKQNRDRIFKIN